MIDQVRLDAWPSLVARAYGLSERELDVTRLCFRGLATKEIAEEVHISPYTVQDHLKSMFDRTGARSRSELVGQVFLEYYVPRWEERSERRSGWHAFDTLRSSQPDSTN